MIEKWNAWAKRCGVLPWRPTRPKGFVPPKLPYPKTWVDLEKEAK